MNIPLTYFWTENHNAMADKLNGRVQAIRDRCGITEYEPYIQAAALFFYRGDYKGLTRELKYNAELPLGRYMAGILGRKLSGSGYFGDVDVVIPVPLHWWRRYRRGYNQAEVIAREVAAALGATVDTATLRRRRHTKSQARLDVGSKAGNVAGAFEVSAIPEWCRSSDGCERKVHHILLIDDVLGFGVTYGYDWILSKRWNMEATVGLGGALLRDRVNRTPATTSLKPMPLRLGLNFIYFIR